MDSHKDQVIEVIYASIDELNALMGTTRELAKSLDPVILKQAEGLDSLGSLNFVSLTEQKCEEQFGKSLPNVTIGRGAVVTVGSVVS